MHLTVEDPAGLHLRLCTDPALLLPDGTRAQLGRKTFALLAYLALEPGVHARQALAALLWPDADESRASMSLRQALAKLKATLGNGLHSDRQSVWLDCAHASAWRCDVTEFLATIEQDPIAATRVDVRAFLVPASIDDAPDFAHWMDCTRASLARTATSALRRAARDAAARREWARASLVAERWIAIDALAEEGVRVAVEAAFMRRDPERGRALFKSYETTLRDGDDRGGTPVDASALASLLRRLESVATMTPMRGVPAVRVGGEHTSVAQDNGGAPWFSVALHGRDDAWRIVSEEWTRVSAGASSVVVAQGTCGSGRTRLLADAASWTLSRGATVLSAASRGGPSALPYHTITALLAGTLDAPALAGVDERHLRVLAELQPDIAQRFPGIKRASGNGNGNGGDQELASAFPLRLFDAMTQVAEALCEDAPLVIALDDITWCDRESAMLLQMLLQRCERLPVLWLASALTDEVPEHPHGLYIDVLHRGVPVALPPLTVTHVCAMLQEFSAETHDWEDFASRVHAASHGVPSLVCATIDASRNEHDALRRAQPRIPLVHQRVSARIDALADMSREVLLGLAVSVPDAVWTSYDAWHARPPVTLDVLSHLHGISRLRAARVGSALAEAHLADERADGFRCASPAVAACVVAASSALVATELRRRMRRLQEGARTQLPDGTPSATAQEP